MFEFSPYAIIPIALAWIFAAIGFFHMVAPGRLVATYRQWGYPPAFPVVAGMLNIAAAVLMATPERRLFGVALAAIILFVSNVMLIGRNHYLGSVPGILLLLALPFAAATSREENRPAFVVAPASAADHAR